MRSLTNTYIICSTIINSVVPLEQLENLPHFCATQMLKLLSVTAYILQKYFFALAINQSPC